jgi:hypothetical protein
VELVEGSLRTNKSYIRNYRRSKKRRVSGTWEVVRILLPPSVLPFHQTIENLKQSSSAIRFRLCARSSAEGEFGKRVVDMIGQMCGCG